MKKITATETTVDNIYNKYTNKNKNFRKQMRLVHTVN